MTQILLQVFLRHFRDPIRVPRIRENYHWVPTDPYQAPNFFLKKKLIIVTFSEHYASQVLYFINSFIGMKS